MKSNAQIQDFMLWAKDNREVLWNCDDPVVIAEYMSELDSEIQEGIAKSREQFIQAVDDARCRYGRISRKSSDIVQDLDESFTPDEKFLLQFLLEHAGELLPLGEIREHFIHNGNGVSLPVFQRKCIEHNVGIFRFFDSGFFFMATEYTGLPSTTLQELQCINKEDPLVLSRVLNTLAVHRPQVVTYANLAAQNNEPGNVAIKTIAQQARILKELGNQTKSFHLQVMKAVGYRLQTTDEHSGNAFDLIKDMRLQGRDANFLHVLMAHIDEYVTPSQLRVAAIPSSAGEKALCRRVSAMNQKLEEYGYRIESDISHIGSVQYVAGYRLRQMEYRK